MLRLANQLTGSAIILMLEFRTVLLKFPLLKIGCGNVDLDLDSKTFISEWAHQGFAKDEIILKNPASSVQGPHNEIKILSCHVVCTELLVSCCL